MKLSRSSKTWNLGDTSFRRKNLMEDYIDLLAVLLKFNQEYDNKWNPSIQGIFFQKVLSDTNLLETLSGENAPDKRARTMTSALSKVGLCTEKRVVSEAGLSLLGKREIIFDEFESKLNLSLNNIVLLRQLIKFRIYDANKNESFNPFTVMMSFIIKYETIMESHFKNIVHSLLPGQDYKKIIDTYSKVLANEISFVDYMELNFPIEEDELFSIQVTDFFNEGKHFKSIFTNRKTIQSVEQYKLFYEKLLKFKENTDNSEVYKELLVIMKSDVIKRAFGTNKIFKLPTGIDSNTLPEFLTNNAEIDLLVLEGKEFRKKFYEYFALYKREDLIKEYYDVTVRTFNLSGVFSFKHGFVKISKPILVDFFSIPNNDAKLMNIKNITFDNYEEEFVEHNVTFMEALQISSVELDSSLGTIKKKYHLREEEDVERYLYEKEENQFIELINENFTDEKLIEILHLFINRDDARIKEKVTDSATIPTIFEYIMGIAWYKISDASYSLLDSFKLSLDGNYLPLSHAVGGDGDIVVDYSDHSMMIEATLMDINTQKRGELEPVIRHSTNLAINSNKEEKNSYAIFVANELDNNVVNIFRMCSFMELESSTVKGEFIKGVKIVSFTTEEIAQFIEKGIKYSTIRQAIDSEFSDDRRNLIELDWREKFKKSIKV